MKVNIPTSFPLSTKTFESVDSTSEKGKSFSRFLFSEVSLHFSESFLFPLLIECEKSKIVRTNCTLKYTTKFLLPTVSFYQENFFCVSHSQAPKKGRCSQPQESSHISSHRNETCSGKMRERWWWRILTRNFHYQSNNKQSRQQGRKEWRNGMGSKEKDSTRLIDLLSLIWYTISWVSRWDEVETLSTPLDYLSWIKWREEWNRGRRNVRIWRRLKEKQREYERFM